MRRITGVRLPLPKKTGGVHRPKKGGNYKRQEHRREEREARHL
jgi:hypothetical protein